MRFVSNAVGKEVVWDSSTMAVLVKDRDSYAEMVELIGKAGKAMDGIQKVKLASKIKLNISGKSSKASLDVNMGEEIDKKAGLMYSFTSTSLFGSDMKFEVFFRNNTQYSLSPGSEWTAKILEEKDFRAALVQDINLESLGSLEVMAASLERPWGRGEGEYTFRGTPVSEKYRLDNLQERGNNRHDPGFFSF